MVPLPAELTAPPPPVDRPDEPPPVFLQIIEDIHEFVHHEDQDLWITKTSI